MDLSPRRLPWSLALLGGAHGWLAACYYGGLTVERRGPDHLLLALLVLVFATAFFAAGWIHVHGRSNHRGGLWRAAVKILVICAAFGVIPSLLLGLRPWSFAIEGVAGAVLVGLLALPSALLLVHAHGARRAPRAGSLLAGTDRAEDALAIVGAMLLLPWWRSSRPHEVALVLLMSSLPAVAIGLHAVILAKQASLLVAAFPRVATSGSSDTTILCDVGFGSEQREARTMPVSAYRTSAVVRTVSCQGDVRHGVRAAFRLLWWSLGVGVVAAAQVGGLLVESR